MENEELKITAIYSVMMQMPMLLNATDETVTNLFSALSGKIVEALSLSPDESVGFDLGESTLYAALKENTYKIELRCEQLKVDGQVVMTEHGFTTSVNTVYM
jgi:hypothetical protein